MANLCADNFPETYELRFFKNEKGWNSAQYSEFVPDDGNALERRWKSMKSYYDRYGKDPGAAEEFRKITDKCENDRHPELGDLQGKLENAGIFPAHIQANYHFHEGKIILFEIAKLNMSKIIQHIAESGNEEQLANFSTIFSVMLKQSTIMHAKIAQKRGVYRDCENQLSYLSRVPIEELYDSVFQTFRAKIDNDGPNSETRRLMNNGDALNWILKWTSKHNFAQEISTTRHEMPLELDADTSRLFSSINNGHPELML